MIDMRRRFMTINESDWEPLYIEAIEDGVAFSFQKEIQISADGKTWEELPANTTCSPIQKDSRIYIKGTYIGTAASHLGFIIIGLCKVGGDLKSLSYGDNAKNISSLHSDDQFALLFKNCTTIKHVDINFSLINTLSDYCYYHMFENCTSLTTAPELPATTLKSNCYSGMFLGCTSLTTAPELPATTLESGCYFCMFENCTSLTTAPELPATTLESGCYSRMFSGCSKLSYIKMLSLTQPIASYTFNWVYGVASSGTFVKNKNATWDYTGVDGIPSGWTVITE